MFEENFITFCGSDEFICCNYFNIYRFVVVVVVLINYNNYIVSRVNIRVIN